MIDYPVIDLVYTRVPYSFTMAPIRLRHPKGVATLQISFDRDDFTVQDLLQEIYTVSDIFPSRQSRV